MSAKEQKPRNNVHVRGKKGVVHSAELKACENTSRFQDTIGFLQNIGYRCTIPDTERDRVKVIVV